MRNLRFRAYHKGLNKMLWALTGIQGELNNPSERPGGIAGVQCLGVGGGESFFPLFEVEIMQWSGFKDKNGVDVYEGDILKYVGSKCLDCGREYEYKGPKLFPVTVEECGEFIAENYDNYMLPNIWKRDMEVVGNIYENPELLEELKKAKEEAENAKHKNDG